jgi:hypothetical protein
MRGVPNAVCADGKARDVQLRVREAAFCTQEDREKKWADASEARTPVRRMRETDVYGGEAQEIMWNFMQERGASAGRASKESGGVRDLQTAIHAR